MALGFGLSKKGIDFESMDARPTHIFFLLVTPEDSTGLHLKVLARISRILKNEPFKEKLLSAESPEDIISVIGEEDEEF
jgi:PTS system nitrogen regulatory IIA component